MNDRFEELYELYCDGELDPGGRAEFLALLEDPAHRARFAELAAFEAAFAEESDRQFHREKKTPRRMAAYRFRREPPRASLWIAAGLAAAFILVILAVARSPRPAAPVVQKPVPKEELRPEPPPPPPLPGKAPAPPVEPPKEERPIPLPPEPPRIVVPSAPPAPRPAVATPAPRTETATAPEKPAPPQVAVLERVRGSVEIAREETIVAGEAGRGLRAGDRVRAGADGAAVIRFPDGTGVSLGKETALGGLSEARAVPLERGVIFVEAARQAAGKSFTVGTPHAEAAVLGTEFTLYVTETFTRLDVLEGRVKFTKPSGVTSITVNAGAFAVSGSGHEFAARPGAGLWKAPAQNLILWLRADAGVRLTDGSVASWVDQSPAGHHAGQAAASARPAAVPEAFGGRPAIRFDGTDDFLALPSGFGDFRAGLTAFAVARIVPGTSWVRILDFGAGPQNDNIFFGRKETADKLAFWVYANDVTRGKVEAPGAITPDQPQTLAVVLAPQGRATLYSNGAAAGSGTTSVPSAVVRKPNFIAKSNYGASDPLFRGDIAELIVYNRALAEAERVYVESYLKAKYFDPTFPPAVSRPGDK